MSTEELRDLMAKLRVQIRDSELNDEARELIHELDADIHDLIGSEKATGQLESILERARRL